jgi:protein-glutamine gamma-glutamyltransferase
VSRAYLQIGRTLDRLLYGLFAVGVITIALSEELPSLIWLAYVPVFLGSMRARNPLARQGLRRLVNAGTVLVFAGLVATAASTGDWLLHAVYFVLLMGLIKLYQRETEWDHYQLVALSFLQILGGAILNPSILFGAAFLAYVVLLAWTLMFLHFRRFDPDRERIRRGVLPPRFFVMTSALAVVLFLSSFLLFFLFPRLGLGFFFTQVRRAQKVAGFSDTVELGGFGTIRDNETVVMRVRGEELGPGARVRLRGMSFDAYDGRAWRRSKLTRHRVTPDIDGHYHLHALGRMSDCRADRITVYVEPLEMRTRLLFGAPWLTEVRPPSSRLDFLRKSKVRVFQDRAGDVFYESKDAIGIQYDAVSRRCPSTGVDARAPGDEAWLMDAYLALPEALDPRVPALAREITAGAGSARASARAVDDWLGANQRYSLDEAHPEEDPIAHFLFDHPEGHCEYFATAMALLLRSVDVPARVVNGFYGGRWNELGRYVQVRHGDAHSWVEVFDAAEGWITFDPTPAAELWARDGESMAREIGQWIDYMRYRWYQWVVEYNLQKQMRVLKGLSSAFDIEPNMRGWRKLKDLVKRGFLGLLTLLALAGLIAGIRSWWRRRVSRGRHHDAGPASRLFREWVRAMRRHQIERQDGDTPLRFGLKVVDAVPAAREDVGWLVEVFGELLYGERVVDPELKREIKARIKRVRERLRALGGRT